MPSGDSAVRPVPYLGMEVGGDGEHGQPPNGLADRGDAVQDFRGHGVGWLVAGLRHDGLTGASSLPPLFERGRRQ